MIKEHSELPEEPQHFNGFCLCYSCCFSFHFFLQYLYALVEINFHL